MDVLYEEEIKSKLKQARDLLDNENNASDTEKIEQAKAQIELAEQTIALLETSARGSKRKSSQLKELVNGLRKEAKELRTIAQNKIDEIDRSKLLGSSSKKYNADGDTDDGEDEMEDLLKKKDRDALSRSSEALENSKKNVLEMEQVAIGITDSLDQSMATINSIKRKVQETTGLADQARSVLRKMENMNARTRLVIMVAVGIVAIGFIVIFIVACDCTPLTN